MNFFVVNDDEIVQDINIEGVETDIKSENGKIHGTIGIKRDSEINLCFLLHQKEIQDIDLKIRVFEGVNAKIITNCALVSGTHNSSFKIEVGKNSIIEVDERHFHGTSQVKVNARTCINLDENSTANSKFELRKGNGGRINYFFCSNLMKSSKLNSIFKGIFKGRDNVNIDENVRLIGEKSSAMIETKTVGMENSEVSFTGKLIGEGKNSKGHMECSEVIMENAVARSTPKLEVIDETSRLTHEAAIGKIDQEKINLLMAKGLDRERAIHKIITGILRD